MKRYWSLILLISVIVVIAVIVRLVSPETIIVEREPLEKVTIYDTVKIISTPDGRNFRARKIELNTASIEELQKAYGIGKVFSERIVSYRQILGGFYSKSQLKEVRGITEEVYRNIEANFWVDTLAIQKINLNFATHKQLTSHPYITQSMAQRMARGAEKRGGYSTLRQLLEDNIILPDEARRIAPYVEF